MKKTILLLTTIGLVTFLVAGFMGFSKRQTSNSGLFHLNIHKKNDAGWFHLTVLNAKDGSTPAAVQNDPTNLNGYHPVTMKTVYPLTLTNDHINELTPTFTVFRDNNGTGTPTRGGWSIEFDISCVGSDLVERKITPTYTIQAKNYFDQLIKDNNGNDGFKIYLIKDFTLQDTTAMRNRNTLEYNTFKTNTGRP